MSTPEISCRAPGYKAWGRTYSDFLADIRTFTDPKRFGRGAFPLITRRISGRNSREKEHRMFIKRSIIAGIAALALASPAIAADIVDGHTHGV